LDAALVLLLGCQAHTATNGACAPRDADPQLAAFRCGDYVEGVALSLVIVAGMAGLVMMSSEDTSLRDLVSPSDDSDARYADETVRSAERLQCARARRMLDRIRDAGVREQVAADPRVAACRWFDTRALAIARLGCGPMFVSSARMRRPSVLVLLLALLPTFTGCASTESSHGGISTLGGVVMVVGAAAVSSGSHGSGGEPDLGKAIGGLGLIVAGLAIAVVGTVNDIAAETRAAKPDAPPPPPSPPPRSLPPSSDDVRLAAQARRAAAAGQCAAVSVALDHIGSDAYRAEVARDPAVDACL
jgi:hypothetical protein